MPRLLLADREAKGEGRKVEYRAVKDCSCASGMQNLKKFYIRGEIKGTEARGMTVLYDQATEGMMAPVVVLMSSAFTAFPTNGIVPSDGPPPRKMVEYSTGVIVSADGAIVADRLAVDSCISIVVPTFGNADRVAQDKTHDLALLRIYGASGLKPLGMAQATAKQAVTITGIADPQNQGGSAGLFGRFTVAPPAPAIRRCSPRPASASGGAASTPIATLPASHCSSHRSLPVDRARRRLRRCSCRPMQCASFSRRTMSRWRAAQTTPRPPWCASSAYGSN